MDYTENEAAGLYTTGAPVHTTSPFTHLPSFKNEEELTQDFIDKWVKPYYLQVGHTDHSWAQQLISVKNRITPTIIQKNLGDSDWRPRQTGAFFAAITNQAQFIGIIGTHLLKSEVPYAGGVYCKVLASFNTPGCVEYLNLYLSYYLSKTDCWFDQKDAMEAILYLDKVNGTRHFETHVPKWVEFVKNKPYQVPEISTIHLENQLALIETVKNTSGDNQIAKAEAGWWQKLFIPAGVSFPFS